MDKAFARVRIIDIPLSIDREYSYFIPPELRGGIKAGTVVVVPFGNANKRVSAVVTGVSDECDYRGVKPVDRIMHYPFDVPEELVRTCAFMKERFFCTFGSERSFDSALTVSLKMLAFTMLTVRSTRL